MKIVTSEQMRELDARTINEFGVPGKDLMARAGEGVADVVEYLACGLGYGNPCVHLFAGRGNNGGDAFVAAYCLQERGIRVEVWLAGEAKAVSGDASIHLSKMQASGITLRELPMVEDWHAAYQLPATDCDVLVDGILGTGVQGPARGPAAGAIGYINRIAGQRPVVAIDIPSGLDADTGEAPGDVVIADVTVTMGLPKSGLVTPRAVNFVGNLEVIDIGVPDELVSRLSSDEELITAEDMRGMLKRRPAGAHKGMFGHVLILAGSPGYSGAAAIAAGAALRSGAGLVTALVPAGVAPIVAGVVPEAMVHPGAEVEGGSLSSDCLDVWGRDLGDFDAILLGPGATPHEETQKLVKQLLGKSKVPLIIDADGLNVCAGRIDMVRDANCPVVLTPHPGEMARLAGCSVADIQSDRFKAARDLAEGTGAVVVLKGAGTVVAKKGKALSINMTGNPGMATGGTGDVLGGLIAGLAGQGQGTFDAARLGVYLHGRAGDNVALASSQAGMIAGDLVEELPNVIRELTGR